MDGRNIGENEKRSVKLHKTIGLKNIVKKNIFGGSNLDINAILLL
jgi:hypothetical protein